MGLIGFGTLLGSYAKAQAAEQQTQQDQANYLAELALRRALSDAQVAQIQQQTEGLRQTQAQQGQLFAPQLATAQSNAAAAGFNPVLAEAQASTAKTQAGIAQKTAPFLIDQESLKTEGLRQGLEIGKAQMTALTTQQAAAALKLKSEMADLIRQQENINPLSVQDFADRWNQSSLVAQNPLLTITPGFVTDALNKGLTPEQAANRDLVSAHINTNITKLFGDWNSDPNFLALKPDQKRSYVFNALKGMNFKDPFASNLADVYSHMTDNPTANAKLQASLQMTGYNVQNAIANMDNQTKRDLGFAGLGIQREELGLDRMRLWIQALAASSKGNKQMTPQQQQSLLNDVQTNLSIFFDPKKQQETGLPQKAIAMDNAGRAAEAAVGIPSDLFQRIVNLELEGKDPIGTYWDQTATWISNQSQKRNKNGLYTDAQVRDALSYLEQLRKTFGTLRPFPANPNQAQPTQKGQQPGPLPPASPAAGLGRSYTPKPSTDTSSMPGWRR